MFKKIGNFFKSTKGTISKLKHPTLAKCIKYGIIIFIVSAVVGVIFSFYDMGVSALVTWIISLFV